MGKDVQPLPCPMKTEVMIHEVIRTSSGLYKCANSFCACNAAYWTLEDWNNLARAISSKLVASKTEGAEAMKQAVLKTVERHGIIHSGYLALERLDAATISKAVK